MNIKKLKNRGLTLVEIMVVTIILASVIGGSYTILASGESAWYTAATNIELSENLRIVLDKLTKEMQETGSNNVGAMQITISDGTGVNGTDVVTFSIPIICEATGSVINANGDVANWGAPLTWGCINSTCMDADNDCLTRDYNTVQYSIDANNQLLRRVLDTGNNPVRTDIFAHNISDFQATLSVDQNVVTINVTAQKMSNLRRILTSSRSIDVYLRNRG